MVRVMYNMEAESAVLLEQVLMTVNHCHFNCSERWCHHLYYFKVQQRKNGQKI